MFAFNALQKNSKRTGFFSAPESYREVHQFMRLVADGDHPGVGVGDPARVVLVLAHAIDDVGLHVVAMRARTINGANDIDLVVLPGLVAAIDVDDVIGVVDAEDRVRRVPVNVVALSQSACRLKEESNL